MSWREKKIEKVPQMEEVQVTEKEENDSNAE